MRFTITKQDLVDATSALTPALPTKPTMPILRGMLITITGDRARFDATDQTTTITTSRPCEGAEDGTVLVAGRLLASIVNSLPQKPITLAVDGTNLAITAGRSNFQLPTMTLDDYPPLPDAPDVVGEVSGHDLSAAVHAAGVATSRDDTLPMLTGIKMEAYDGGITLAATDRFRLAVRTIDWDGQDFDLLAPARTLLDAVKQVGAQSAQILTDGSRFGLRFGATTIITRLIDADFPKYLPLIQTSSLHQARIGRQALIDAVKRVGTLATATPQVTLDMVDGQVTVTSHGADTGTGSDTLDCEMVGESTTMAFNSGYLLDGLANIDDDRVLITMQQPGRPAMLWPDLPCDDNKVPDATDAYLIMPVRLPG